MHKILLFSALLLSSTATLADVSTCIQIEGDLDRLACYDREAGRTPETVETQSGNWNVQIDRSEFKDTTDVYLNVLSEDPVSCGFSGASPINLVLRCQENTTSLILSTHCHVASGFSNYGRVEYRIDDQKVVSRNFDESTNNRSLGLWSGRQAIPAIKSMLNAQRLLVRFTPFNENPVTAAFPIAGLSEAISPLRESCNW